MDGKGVIKNSALDSFPGHTDVNTVYFLSFSWLPEREQIPEQQYEICLNSLTSTCCKNVDDMCDV